MLILFLPTIFAIVFSLIVASPVAAADVAMKKYGGYSPEQIKALPEDVRRKKVPIVYDFAANTALTFGQVGLGGMLNSLMYNGMGDYRGAIRAFQNDLGEEATGELTVGQIYELQYRVEMQKVSPPSIPSFFFSDTKLDGQANDGYARVRGTLQLLDEKAAFPVNNINMECDQHRGYCMLHEVAVQFPSRKDFRPDFSILWPGPSGYRITKWTKDIVEADYESVGNQCRNTKLQLNFKTKEYYMITTNAGKQCEVLGAKFEKLKRPRIAKVVDGREIIRAEVNAFRKKQYEFLASDYRKAIELAIKSATANRKP